MLYRLVVIVMVANLMQIKKKKLWKQYGQFVSDAPLTTGILQNSEDQAYQAPFFFGTSQSRSALAIVLLNHLK